MVTEEMWQWAYYQGFHWSYRIPCHAETVGLEEL